jgi:ankyrin repeat protein
LLIDKDAPLDSPESKALHPLFLAVKNEDIKVVSLLIESGANINETLSDGSTTLHHAASVANYDLVKQLLEKGVAVKAKNKSGNDTFSDPNVFLTLCQNCLTIK